VTEPADAPSPRGRVGEVFAAFLKLGVTSFGGPIAHLGFFRAEFVERRGWLTDREYGDLVALSQFLPGPSSSQVGFALGLRRAGPLGALAAFFAFTLPSAVLLVLFASGLAWLDSPIAAGALSGLKVVAVAIVAHAVLGMARTLAPDVPRAAIALVALVVVGLVGGAGAPLAAILLGAIAGIFVCRLAVEEAPAIPAPVSRTTGVVALALFGILVVGLPLLAGATGSPAVALADAFFRAGSLVFGGGHVVLPLLEAEVVGPGWVDADTFLAGYGAAQAVPGPLFTFAGYLGAVVSVGPGGVAGAAIALVAIFLPGFLLLVGVLPFWDALRMRPGAQGFIRGANAAVVGILAAALYAPVFTSAVVDAPTFVLAAVCFILLTALRTPPWAVVLLAAGAGALPALG
jgi:chromate transporter